MPRVCSTSRAEIAVLPVFLAGSVLAAVAGGPAASYQVHRAPGSHDALLAAADASWSAASVIDWGAAPAHTTFRALWNDRGVYVRFDAEDPAPWNTMTTRDEHLWDEEVVEIFLDLDRSGRHYAELEINPANVVCDVHMIAPAPDKQNDLTWNIAGLETRVTRREGAPPRWIPVAFMPWDGFRTLPSARNTRLPPHAGDAWRFNVFRIERPGGPRDPERGAIFAAWSPPSLPSFHDPAAFRDFVYIAP
jgi:hypothetical protein